jgi:acyl-CoA thioester hydrolase
LTPKAPHAAREHRLDRGVVARRGADDDDRLGEEKGADAAHRAHSLDTALGSRPMRHEKRVEIRWSDVDAYMHVNNAVYATYLEECRDEWVDAALGQLGDAWDFVLARVAIDFRRELRLEDEEVVVSCTLRRIGNASVTLSEEIRTREASSRPRRRRSWSPVTASLGALAR